MLLNCGVGEDSWESPVLQIKPFNPKGNQPRIFIARTDAEAETPILWPPDKKYCLIWKDPDAGKDWRQEEKWKTEDEMVGWYHQLNGPEFEQAPTVGDRQGSLLCCSPWGRKELDTTEKLTWTELKIITMQAFCLKSNHTHTIKMSLIHLISFPSLNKNWEYQKHISHSCH